MDKLQTSLDLVLSYNSKYVRFYELDALHGTAILTLYLDEGNDDDVDDFVQALVDHGCHYVVNGLVSMFLLECKHDDEENDKRVYIELSCLKNRVMISTERANGVDSKQEIWMTE